MEHKDLDVDVDANGNISNFKSVKTIGPEPDKAVNQIFAIRSILISYCGHNLTANWIDIIMGEIEAEITNGPCAWAFK